MARKEFLKRNEAFLCLRCGENNPPAAASTRNHCFACLFSLHVDEATPGDRKSACGGLMEAIMLDQRGKKGFMILHRCVKCDKEMWNRCAEDDEVVKFQSVQWSKPTNV